MRANLTELLCCPECRHPALALAAFEEVPAEPLPWRSGADPDETREIVSGLLSCAGCERLYFVSEGIPRLLSEDYAELIDTGFPARFAAELAPWRRELDGFLARLEAAGPHRRVPRWNVEDVAFWEEEVYGRADRAAELLANQADARPDAGNRTYPRERNLFRHLRPALPGGTLLDLGCGLAQSVRTLCHPAEVGYQYVGAELSLSALRADRATLPGEYVQCSVDRLPFRASSVDAVTMLGTLHHLADHDGTLRRVLEVVRDGGWIGLHEVAAHESLSTRVPLGGRLRRAESSHNESVDVELVRRRLAEAGTIEVLHRGYSPLRALLVRWLAGPMRTRPWLTRLVIGLDALCIRTLGRLSPAFEGRELIVFARKSGGPAAMPSAR